MWSSWGEWRFLQPFKNDSKRKHSWTLENSSRSSSMIIFRFYTLWLRTIWENLPNDYGVKNGAGDPKGLERPLWEWFKNYLLVLSPTYVYYPRLLAKIWSLFDSENLIQLTDYEDIVRTLHHCTHSAKILWSQVINSQFVYAPTFTLLQIVKKGAPG